MSSVAVVDHTASRTHWWRALPLLQAALVHGLISAVSLLGSPIKTCDMYINIILFLQFTVFNKKEMKLIAVMVLVVIGLAVTGMFLCSSYSCVVWNSPASFPLVIYSATVYYSK